MIVHDKTAGTGWRVMAFAVFMAILYLIPHKSAVFYSHGCTEVRDVTSQPPAFPLNVPCSQQLQSPVKISFKVHMGSIWKNISLTCDLLMAPYEIFCLFAFAEVFLPSLVIQLPSPGQAAAVA